MIQDTGELVVLFYNPATRKVTGRGGKFVSLEDFAKYPPRNQEEILPKGEEGSVPNPRDVPPLPGPVLKCIDGKLHVCLDTTNRCYNTGVDCTG